MVIAAALRVCCNREESASSTGRSCSLGGDCLREPSEEERGARLRNWNIWTNSIADDIDLVGDWWFYIDTARRLGCGATECTDFGRPKLITALMAFSIIGSVTWFLEVWDTAWREPRKICQNRMWVFLPLLVICLEDIPQIVITAWIRSELQSLSSLAVFNIMTSLYSMIIKITGQVFLNCCYGPTSDGSESELESLEAGRVVVPHISRKKA